jgi:hypothetical protein
MIKTIDKRISKVCVICGKTIKVLIYNDRSYRGGHYFGTDFLKRKDPQGKQKTIKAEYWECPNCYWVRWK